MLLQGGKRAVPGEKRREELARGGGKIAGTEGKGR